MIHNACGFDEENPLHQRDRCPSDFVLKKLLPRFEPGLATGVS